MSLCCQFSNDTVDNGDDGGGRSDARCTCGMTSRNRNKDNSERKAADSIRTDNN